MENYDNIKENKSSIKNNSQKIKESIFSINNLSNILPRKEGNTKQM